MDELRALHEGGALTLEEFRARRASMSLEEREDLKALSLAAALQASPEPENAAARKEHAESIGEAPSAWLEVRAALVFCAGRKSLRK